jgi:hypothetical protein
MHFYCIFIYWTIDYWLDYKHRKQVFLSYAAERGFKPDIPSNWYMTDLVSMLHKKVRFVTVIPCFSSFAFVSVV